MFGYFDYEKLNEIASSSNYGEQQPFPHAVIDNAASAEKLTNVRESFPKPEDLSWWSYDNYFEKKLAFDKAHLLPRPILEALLEMNGAQFLGFLEKMTGIKGLIPDPYFTGGGLHQIPKGGKLKLHVDFNLLKSLNLDRRINVILYLNKDWQDSYGGALELWNMDKTVSKSILPIFNRMAIFSTTETSLHGHPHDLTCPEGETRKSLALYYYTSGRPESERAEAHSTVYQFYPGEEVTPELEEMRQRRTKGRI